MRQPEILDVDPKVLHLLPSQAGGADRFKLQSQIARFGASTRGMPPRHIAMIDPTRSDLIKLIEECPEYQRHPLAGLNLS